MRRFPRKILKRLHCLKKSYQRCVRARVLLEEGKITASRELFAGIATIIKDCYESGILTEEEYKYIRGLIGNTISAYDWVIRISYGEGDEILISQPQEYVKLVEKVRYVEDRLLILYTDKVHLYTLYPETLK